MPNSVNDGVERIFYQLIKLTYRLPLIEKKSELAYQKAIEDYVKSILIKDVKRVETSFSDSDYSEDSLNVKRVETSFSDSDYSEDSLSKILNFMERIGHIAPQTWQKCSFHLPDILEDHRENLIPTWHKHGCEWVANLITYGRLIFFLWHFGLSSLRTAMTTLRTKT
jgi:hypothetical protein